MCSRGLVSVDIVCKIGAQSGEVTSLLQGTLEFYSQKNKDMTEMLSFSFNSGGLSVALGFLAILLKYSSIHPSSVTTLF